MRVEYFAIEVAATPADGRTISALDAKTRVTTQQILSTIWQRSKAHNKWPLRQSGLSDFPIRIISARRPIQTVIVDNEGIDVRKIDDSLALRFVQFTLTIPS